MTDRELDHIIKRLLEHHQPEANGSSWEQLEERMDQELTGDVLFDDVVRTSMGIYHPDDNSNWERMEQALIQEEAAFDGELKEKVEHYEAPYNSDTWPVLKAKITEDERLHRRIIIAKVLEIAAILIAFVTVYNFFPAIQTAVIEPTGKFMLEKLGQKDHADTPEDNTFELTGMSVADPGEVYDGNVGNEKVKSNERESSLQSNVPKQINFAAQRIAGSEESAVVGSESPRDKEIVVTANAVQVADQVSTVVETHSRSGHDEVTVTPSDVSYNIAIASPVQSDREEQSLPKERSSISSFATLTSLTGGVETSPRSLKLGLETFEITRKTGLRFSMSASTEINQLYIPADHFYSLGKQVRFTEKDMTAFGYSAGASLLFDKGVFTFETGLHYSRKTYQPNRILHIGETFDVRTLDFKNISLNIISLPFQLHWNFDRKGKVRMYTVGGMSMNLIATAHYDLITTNNFRSSAAPADPSFNRTTQEVNRIREHILDDAEFSAKSFLTVNAGFGIERLINHKFSVFVQPTASYQIPFFHISDQNGKHLQYISTQVGTRIRLR